MNRENRQVKVESIEVNGGIVKGPRGGYAVLVSYIGVDGNRYDGQVFKRLLRDAKAYVASLPLQPDSELAVVLNDAGKVIGTMQRFQIGGQR